MSKRSKNKSKESKASDAAQGDTQAEVLAQGTVETGASEAMVAHEEPSAEKPKKARTPKRRKPKHGVITSDNDNVSAGMAPFVPERYRDTGQFIDVVQWNLEWFGAARPRAKDNKRFDLVVQILETLNADLFVLQEVAGPSKDGRYPGVMDEVAAELTRRGAGDYVVHYTEAGGEQRVAMMWDRDWIRAKSEVSDLFVRGTHQPPGGKDPFAGRTPLYGCFSARIPSSSDVPPAPGAEKFDFQVVAVHLKSMAEGASQRAQTAHVLADWLRNEAPLVDADALVIGLWNAPPDAPEWHPIRALEQGVDAGVSFSAINDPGPFSYLWLENRSSGSPSRIDPAAITLASFDQVVSDQVAEGVTWTPIQEVLARAGNLKDKQVITLVDRIKDTVSEHLPILSRFYVAR